jgi:hypothetical protein
MYLYIVPSSYQDLSEHESGCFFSIRKRNRFIRARNRLHIFKRSTLLQTTEYEDGHGFAYFSATGCASQSFYLLLEHFYPFNCSILPIRSCSRQSGKPDYSRHNTSLLNIFCLERFTNEFVLNRSSRLEQSGMPGSPS